MTVKNDYSEDLETAQELIYEFGTEWTYRETVKGVYDPATGLRPVDSVITETVTAVRLQYNVKEIDGEVIKHGDFKLLMAGGAGFTPNLAGEFVSGSDAWQIVSFEELNPADTVILYTFQVR